MNKSDTSSDTSCISVEHMRNIVEKLKQNKNRDSTKAMNHNVWTGFNKFILRLNVKPNFGKRECSYIVVFLLREGANPVPSDHTYLRSKVYLQMMVTNGRTARSCSLPSQGDVI